VKRIGCGIIGVNAKWGFLDGNNFLQNFFYEVHGNCSGSTGKISTCCNEECESLLIQGNAVNWTGQQYCVKTGAQLGKYKDGS
jgi:hypothetical protein